MLPEMDLRYSNRTVLTLSPGWLQTSLSDSRSGSNMLLLAALYGREDLSQRLSRVHDRVALSAAGLYNVRGSQGPRYTTVDALPGFSVHMPAADVLLAMINTNFPPRNKVTLTDDVYMTTGGLQAILLAGSFAHEVAIDDAEAAGAFVSTLLLWRLAVPSSATLSSMLHLSKYRCFEFVQDVAPHATALFLAEDIVPTSNIDIVDTVIDSVRKVLAADLAKLPESERRSYYHRLRMIETVIEVPEDLFDEAMLERHYSSLPVFRAPFVRSYLLALRIRADRAKATLHRRVPTTRRMSHRLSTLAARPVLLPFYGVLHVPVASLLPPMVVRESPEATYAALGHLVARELVSALDLTAGNTAPNGLVAAPRSGAKAAAVQSRLACLRRSAPAKAGVARLEEVYADAAGLRVALRALRATTPGFKPLEQSTLVQGWSRLQLFYMSSCYKWCALHANEAEGTAGTHRERCNAPVAEDRAFLSAFNCSAESRMFRQRKGCFSNNGS